MNDFSAEDKLACVERELRFRRPQYANRVRRGAITQDLADREIALMEAIADDYRRQVAS